METKTVKELRELARKLDVTGYSKLRKEELLTAIKKAAKTKPAAKAAAKKKAPAKSAKKAAASSKAAKKKVVKKKAAAKMGKTAAPAEPAAEPVTRPALEATEEERIESAKFVTTVAGTAAYHSQFPPDLGEDIDTLPDLGEPRLTLLLQKPGVLMASWHLEPGRIQRDRDLRLRLGVLADQKYHVKQEVPITDDRGNYYFHVDPEWPPSAIYLQLGHYGSNGRFIIAIRRGIVRLPRLFALSSLGINWALDEAEFERAVKESGPLGRLPYRAVHGAPSSLEWITSGAPSSHSLVRKGP
jgi:hypothetical protein